MRKAVLALVLLAGCGGSGDAVDGTGMTKEMKAFKDAQEKQAQDWMERMRRDAPRPPIRKPPLLHADTSVLSRTIVVPHTRIPLADGKNVVWCATWQLAWDSMCNDVVKGPLLLGPPAPEEDVAEMNRHPFPGQALDPASYLACAGPYEVIVPRIRKELLERFGTEMLPVPPVMGASIVAYGFLRKSLPFEHQFEPMLAPLDFEGSRVLAFGANCGSSKPDISAALRQVYVVGDDSPHEFILEFAVKGGKDRLVLAMVPAMDTLEETWAGVRTRLGSSKGKPLDPGAGLAVPRMDFSLDHRFQEFLGARVLDGPTKGHVVIEARQTVRFSLNEGGAVLESHGVLGTGLGSVTEYVVSRPFLLALIEKGSTEPYLLMWIANAELLAEAP